MSAWLTEGTPGCATGKERRDWRRRSRTGCRRTSTSEGGGPRKGCSLVLDQVSFSNKSGDIRVGLGLHGDSQKLLLGSFRQCSHGYHVQATWRLIILSSPDAVLPGNEAPDAKATSALTPCRLLRAFGCHRLFRLLYSMHNRHMFAVLSISSTCTVV